MNSFAIRRGMPDEHLIQLLFLLFSSSYLMQKLDYSEEEEIRPENLIYDKESSHDFLHNAYETFEKGL